MKTLGLFSLLGLIPPAIVGQLATGGNDVSTLLTISNFGVLGIVAYLYFSLVRQLITKLGVERDEAYVEIRALNKEIREKLLPALIRCTEVLARIDPKSEDVK